MANLFLSLYGILKCYLNFCDEIKVKKNNKKTAY